MTVCFDGPGWEEHDFEPLADLPLRALKLRPALPEEDPGSGEKYAVQDTFVGGRAFLRVKGEPIWLDRPELVTCSCGQMSQFVAGIGYESGRRVSGIIDDQTPFFLGELALYFFACLPCRRVTVISQPT